MRSTRLGVALVLLAVGFGCGGKSGAVGRPAADRDVTLSVRTVPGLGDLLVTRGWTLYMYSPDRQRQVTCTPLDDCQADWPPLFLGAGHRVVAGPGVKPRLIGTMPGDGGRVVTYNHWPLYYYADDRAADSVNGQGQGFNWYVVGPDGLPNKTAFPSQTG